MPLAENIAERLVVKAYASGDIDAITEPDPSVAPAATGGQILRYVTQSLSLTKDRFAANEKRPDRTMAMGRHGTKRVPGRINGLLSPATYGDLFEASLQGTWAAAVTASQSDFTSVSADNATSKFVFAGGNPVTKGYRVGDIWRFADLADPENNGKNFLILAFGGTQNREVTVYPAPDTMSPDTSFSLTTVGQTLYRPISSHVKRKVAFEVYNPDIDAARLYTEGRMGGFNLSLPPSDNVQVDFGVMARNRVLFEASNAPFFTNPAAATTTAILAGVNGLLRINGATVAVVTGLSIAYAMEPRGPSVDGSRIMPEIFLPAAAVTGNVTTLYENDDISQLFDDEDEIDILCYLTADNEIDAPAMSLYLPRVKLGSANESDGGDLGKLVSYDFEAATYEGSAAGVQSTVLRICDTQMA